MIADAIRQAQRMHRQVLEATYDGICSSYTVIHEKNPVTKVMEKKEVLSVSNLPCHLSYSSKEITIPSDTIHNVGQEICLFLAPEIVIKPGSRIEVTQNGKTENYSQSGKAAVYSSHQEIRLELWKGYT